MKVRLNLQNENKLKREWKKWKWEWVKRRKQIEYLPSLSDIPSMAAAINKAWDDNNYCPER